MDRINFLLTEVALECLGNRFFDIYGDHSATLLNLVSADSLKQKSVVDDHESDLWCVLDMDKHAVRTKNQGLQIAAQSPRKRRASLSNKEEIDDPESLLVPMEKAPELTNYKPPAKINRRRFTMNLAQLQKQRKENPPPVPDCWKGKGSSVPEIKEKLRNDIKSSEYCWLCGEIVFFSVFTLLKCQNINNFDLLRCRIHRNAGIVKNARAKISAGSGCGYREIPERGGKGIVCSMQHIDSIHQIHTD